LGQISNQTSYRAKRERERAAKDDDDDDGDGGDDDGEGRYSSSLVEERDSPYPLLKSPTTSPEHSLTE